MVSFIPYFLFKGKKNANLPIKVLFYPEIGMLIKGE